MTWFDYAVLAIVVASALVGLLRGLVSEILSLTAWVAAFLLARVAAEDVGVVLAQWIEEPAMRYVVAFAAVFLGVLLAFGLLRVGVRGLLRLVGLGALDRTLGALFGLARAVLVIVLLVLVGGMTAAPQQPWWRDATTAQPLESVAVSLKPWLPQTVAKRIRYR